MKTTIPTRARQTCVFVFACLLFFFLLTGPLAAEDGGDPYNTGMINGKPFRFGQEDLNSRTVCLTVFSEGEARDLLRFRQDEKVYVASLTKLMTGYSAYLLLEEKGKDLDDKATVQAGDLEGLAALNASIAGFQAGERVSFRDLFYGLMLSSGCDAANTLARESAGSISAFVERMNQDARDLGLSDSSFANTTGLFHADNVSSSRDMTQLLKAVREIDFLRLVLESRYYTSEGTEAHPHGISMVHYLSIYGSDSGVDTKIIDGGKTGQIRQAGYCLASFKQIGDLVFYLSTTGAESQSGHVSDHAAIYRALLDQLPAEGEIEITGIGDKLALNPAPGETGEDVPREDPEEQPESPLTAITVVFLALLIALVLALLITSLIRRRMDEEADEKKGKKS